MKKPLAKLDSIPGMRERGERPENVEISHSYNELEVSVYHNGWEVARGPVGVKEWTWTTIDWDLWREVWCGQ